MALRWSARLADPPTAHTAAHEAGALIMVYPGGMIATLEQSATTHGDLTRFDRILLHLRCLYHDHNYRWHLAGVWRELRLR